jgi:stage II sporulation protein D
MRVRRTLLPVLAVLAACSGADRPPDDVTPGRREPPVVRVLLSAFEAVPELSVTHAGAYRVTVADDPGDVLLETRASGRVRIRAQGDGIAVAGTPFDREELRIDPGSAVFALGARAYRGTLVVRRDRVGKLAVVLETDVETYLPGVVAGEMPASFPSAAHRAQAIAARTYVLYHHEVRRGDDWDVTDDTRSQMFVGVPTGEHATAFLAAARATRGLVLLHGSRLLPAYYHSTCGGRTASAVEVFGGPAIPALSGVPCGDCGASPRYRWERVVPAAALGKAAGLSGPATGFRVVSRTPSGRAGTVRVEGPGARELPAAELRRALRDPALPSAWIDEIRPVSGGFSVRGRGYGHGVGLCQYGAAGAAARGRDGKAILRDAYPGATIARLY